MRKRRTSSWLRGALAALAMTALAGTQTACAPRLTADFVRTALWTATIVGYVAVLETHDAHFHFEHCGHYRRWHESQWVYYYQGRWEYYSQGDGRWYFYIEQ